MSGVQSLHRIVPWRPPDPDRTRTFAIITALSLGLHAGVLLLLIMISPGAIDPPLAPPVRITLVPAASLPIGAGADAVPAPVSAPTPAMPSTPKRVAMPRPAARRPSAAARAPAAAPNAAPSVTAEPTGGAERAEGGSADAAAVSSNGAGTTGAGSGAGGSPAQPDYATNPKPPYPALARRMRVEGLVLLRVLVRADGRVSDVALDATSGSKLLDDSALRTVRDAWRFAPALAGGVAVDSTVQVPVRFRLVEAR